MWRGRKRATKTLLRWLAPRDDDGIGSVLIAIRKEHARTFPKKMIEDWGDPVFKRLSSRGKEYHDDYIGFPVFILARYALKMSLPEPEDVEIW